MPFFTTPKTKFPPPEKSQSKLAKDGQDLSRISSASSIDSEPDAPTLHKGAAGCYTASSSASPNTFTATSQLQIHAPGYNANQVLTGMTLENISVYRVGSEGPEYTSIRLKKSSNSCALVRATDSSCTPLIATIYRWGPGRPRMRILPPHTPASIQEAINSDHVEGELVEVRSRSMISRAQKMDTSFGAFEWRYGSRAERKEAYDAASLLILERTDSVSSAGGKMGKRGVRVAQLVRNDEFRTPGTSRYMGGNGGRLMIDLSTWAYDDTASAKGAEAFVVASCICMLKREADRFRDNNIAAVV